MLQIVTHHQDPTVTLRINHRVSGYPADASGLEHYSSPG